MQRPLDESITLYQEDKYADETALTAEGSYGQALSDLPLLKGSVNGLPGTWSWLDPTILQEVLAFTKLYKTAVSKENLH